MKKYLRVSCLFFPFFISVITYLNCLQHSFVYDDESTIVNNYFIRHWENIPELFTGKYFILSAELTYRPVVTLSYFIDYTFWHLNPTGYHLTNMLLHAVNSTLFFIFTCALFRKRVTALTASLFFSVYPLFTEVVNAVGFREDLLAFLFLILAFICFVKAHQKKYTLHYTLSLLCFFLSIFSKEMAITLPLLIIIYDVMFPGLSNGNNKPPALSYLKVTFLRYYLGYGVVAIFYLLVRFFFLHNPTESHVPYPHDSLFFNVLTMTHVLACYIKLLFLPFHLNADYVVPLTTSLVKISFWISCLLLIVTGIFSFRLRSRHKYIFFFIVWFFVTLMPVMNIIPLGNLMAERYLYIPGAGFCMIIACLVSGRQIMHGVRSDRYSPMTIPSMVLVFFLLIGNACLTFQRNGDWKDGLQLWSKTSITSPNSFRVHINLGNAYEKKGLNAAALEEYKKALSIDPNDADIYNNLGVYYNTMNLFDDAIRHFTQCLDINPQHARAHNNLGVVLTRQRHLDDAIQAFKQAISINALYPDAHNNLGIAYYRKGLMDEAEREFKLAIRIEPYHAEAHNDLGILYNDKHRYDNALREFEQAVRIKPDYANAHMNLGAVILRHRKDKDAALFHLKESIKIDPYQEQSEGIGKLIQQLKGSKNK